MADLSAILAAIEHDPDDAQAHAELASAARQTPPDTRGAAFANARKQLAARGRPDAVAQLIDAEMAATGDTDRKVDLLLEKGMILDGDLLDAAGARAAFDEVLRMRGDDTMAREAIGELAIAEENWQKFADKYLREASSSTDRSLASSLYVSAAESFVRFAPGAPEGEAYLRRALEIDPKHGKAAFHLARLLRRAARWDELAAHHEQRVEHAPAVADRVSALLGLAQVARDHLGDAERAQAAMRRVLALDPNQPQALRAVTESNTVAGDSHALLAQYQAALRARREDDLGLLLQIGMLLWKHLGDADQAEDYFRRIRRIEPAHPAALDFYRAYYPAKGESGKLIALLKSVDRVGDRAGSPTSEQRTAGGRARPISREIAELSEQQHNPEKAIEAWKQHLRADPTSQEAREALSRLYRKTEKWNALLDLMKDEIDRLPEGDVAGRVARMFDVIEIYRDRLRLDVMVINTYNAILKLDPDNQRATDELIAKYRALGRWNDVIALLSKKVDGSGTATTEEQRVALLREIADLWAERFGNFANAIKPLERILELAPSDADALARLKDIYTRRRQWRQLVDVLAREAAVLPAADRRAKHGEMARLAAERLGDNKLAIEIYNTVLAEAGGEPVAETLGALAGLYEREKRYLALAEILERQVAGLRGAREAVPLLEKLGQIYADRAMSPQLAAGAWQQILDIEPNHAKALRTLRELYATAGDFAGLERLYARLGQEDELVEALLGIADRIEARASRLPLVERAAQLAQKRADASPDGGPILERARQVWERVLAVDPQHVAAATALAPIYAKQEKWARLISVLEIALAAAPDRAARLAKIAQIRQLCEQRLASRNLAFVWTVRAFDLDPESEQLFADLMRLAGEAEQWREVIAAFEGHLPGGSRGDIVDPPTRLRFVREMARIAARRLGDLEGARAYHRRVLALAPDDADAESSLEELATQLHDWPELLASYRRRAERAGDATERAALLLDIAALQEEKLVDLDGAAAAYHEALAAVPGNLRALRAVARIEEARGDWEMLASVLGAELAQTADLPARFELTMRLGRLEQTSLERPARALGFYRAALGLASDGPLAASPARLAAVNALTQLVLPERRGGNAGIDPGAREPIRGEDRIAVAHLLLPHLRAGGDTAAEARALEVLRGAEGSDRIEIDRQLMRLYHVDLGDPGAAWDAGLRVVAADPADADVRQALGALAGQLGRDGEWARHLSTALAALRASGAPDDVRAVATELARVHGERLGDRAGAEAAWKTVLEVEPDAPDAFEALAAGYRDAERFTDLRGLLERRVEVTGDDAIRRSSLLELAVLEEDLLGEPARAIVAHQRVLELDPAYLPSYQALDRLYAASGRWRDLEGLLARQGEHAARPEVGASLAYRRAELLARRLDEAGRAVDLLEEVLGRSRDHGDARALLAELLAAPATAADGKMRIARILEPLYEHDKQWKELVGVLRVQRTLVSGPEAVELLARIASISELELGAAGSAFDAWVEVLRLDPTHERARVEMSRLAPWLSRWPEATAALEAAADATPATDVATRAALLGDLALYYDTEGHDPARAITAYTRLLDADPTNPATIRRAGGALSRLHEAARAWPELRAVLRKQAEWADDPAHRRALLARVAGLEEHELADRKAAIATWRDVLADQPADAGALDALERLYQASERWRDLIEILRRKAEHASQLPAGATGSDARALLARVAEVHEVMLEEPTEAIAAYLEVLDRSVAAAVTEAVSAPLRAGAGVDPHESHALAELARLYREGGRHADLLDILERQASGLGGSAPSDGPALEREVEIARLLGGPLARPVDALDRWSRVLQRAPIGSDAQIAALSAMEAATLDVDLRMAAADLLLPYYEATGQDDRLAALYLRLADWSDDASSKLRALGQVVRLREHRLADPDGAFAAQLLALRVAATEPELAGAVAETERLAADLGRESDLIDAYREVAPSVLDAEIQRRLYLDVADLARAIRRDLPLARDYYQKVLDAQPEDGRALAALESIYRETNDDTRLVEVLLRQAELSGADADDRVTALVEAAGLYAALGRTDDAISTWEQVLATAPERRDAVAALEPLYRTQGRWHDVVDLYERRLGFATGVDEAVALRVQLGQIHERELRDVESAIDNYSAALSGDARNPEALAALERYLGNPDVRAAAAEVLEPIYVGQHRWPDLIRVYEAKLEAASDPRERLKLTRFVARLYEEQLEDFENASHWYARVFREAPADAGVRDQLQRLASIVDNWGFVAQTYQRFLDDESGDSPEIREVAIAAAGIYDRRLGDADHAYAAYRRALSIAPADAPPEASGPVAFLDERELVRRLEELLLRAQKFPELVTIYDDVIARGDEELRVEALVKRARLLEQGIEDLPRAIDGWREVIVAAEDTDPVAYREAVRELDRLYRQRAQWHDLVDLFEARLQRTNDPVEIAELRLGLAELLETQMADLPAAIDQYEHVVAEGRLWERAVAALERLVVHEEHRERIAELLEPVYRGQDWWQKLVVILDAKLAYVRDPADQVAVLHEIAELHEQRGGALDLALTALARAWRIDVTDDESLTKLLALSGKLEAWDEAVEALEAGAPSAPNAELVAGLWARAAEIHETRRGDNARAIAAWRKVDEARSDDVVALAALDRLLAVGGRVDELVVIVERRADLSDDAGVRLVLLHRVAALYEEVLGDKPKAVVAYKNVLAVDDTDLTALDALERIYRSPDSGGTPRDLAETLERKIELTSDIAGRRVLRHAAAQVYERDLADVYQAIAHLVAILDDDAGDATALAELDRIYAREKMWADLLEVVDRRALLASSARDRADLAYRAAHLVETELRDPEAAISRYGAVLQVLPGHVPARAALEGLMAATSPDEQALAVAPLLERVYRTDRDAAGLIRVYERRLAASGGGHGDPVTRRADWAALADVHEVLAGDPRAAFAVWARALASDPEDVELLAPLQRLADAQSMWTELATILDERLAATLPPETEQIYAMRLGEIAEDRARDLTRAAAAFQRASHGPEPRPALAALERVLARAGSWPELAEVLRRQADAADDDTATADYLFRLGDLQETTLADRRAAVAAYREVLALAPSHARARGSLERILASSSSAASAGHAGGYDPRAEIVDILEPLFEQDGDAPRLSAVLEARLAITSDALDRAALLQRLVELAEGRLGDRARALDAALRWLAADPSSAHALSEVDRLAERLGQWPEVAARVGAIVGGAGAHDLSAETRVALHGFVGRVQRERLGHLDEAAAAYRAALAIEPDELAALDPLIDILRTRGDHAALAEALRHRGRVVADVSERRAAFAEVAALSERAGDTAAAIAAWSEVAESDDADHRALAELARIYRPLAATSAEHRDALIDVLGKAARVAGTSDEEKQLRIEIARLEGDTPRAVAAWQAVLDLDAEDAPALLALEAAQMRAGDWMAVSDLQTRRLSLARTSSDKVAILAEMARLAEIQRASIDDAVASWFAALDLDGAYHRGFDELERLLARAERWHDLVELLERRAELHATLSDAAAEIGALARAADVWEARLDDPDAAGVILEKILAREPGSVAALTRLSKIYERAGDWARCKAALEQALALQPTGRDAADLFFRLGEVARAGDGDPDTAVQHYQHALRHEPTHAAAIAALETIARDRRDGALLADMLQRRAGAVTAPAERVALFVEIADLERKAGRTDHALAALAKAAADAPTDVRVLGPLADLYFAAGRLDEAAPIYDQLADEAKRARRMKDVARYRQRQGGILEARGDAAGAMAAYEEALRVNPTDVPTMVGLGRLYFAAKDWEKARKIYQSLVLQNIDADAGVTKGEVYWSLGRILIELGQAPKARSMFQRGLEIEPGNAQLRDALAALG